MPQALRSRPVPPGLKFWLDMVEDIPADRELEAWSTSDLSGCVTVDDVRAAYLRSYEPLLAALSPAAQRYVWAREVHAGQRAFEVGERYEQLRAVLEILRAVARRPKGRPIDIEVPYIIRLYGMTLRVDSNGISVALAPLFDALKVVETDRIRECQNCKRLYWAGRSDQPCCSQRCANARRVRAWRAEYGAKHKLARVKKPLKTGRKGQNKGQESKNDE
jgi:hypothetical protein